MKYFGMTERQEEKIFKDLGLPKEPFRQKRQADLCRTEMCNRESSWDPQKNQGEG